VTLWYFPQEGNDIPLDSYPYIYFIVLLFMQCEAGIKGIIKDTNEIASCSKEKLHIALEDGEFHFMKCPK
jgi:hypothetical protein